MPKKKPKTVSMPSDQNITDHIETARQVLLGLRNTSAILAYLQVLRYLQANQLTQAIIDNLQSTGNEGDLRNNIKRLLPEKIPDRHKAIIALLVLPDSVEYKQSVMAVITEMLRPRNNRTYLQPLLVELHETLQAVVQANNGGNDLVSQLKRPTQIKAQNPTTKGNPDLGELLEQAKKFSSKTEPDLSHTKSYLTLLFELWNYSDKNRPLQSSENALLKTLQNKSGDRQAALISVLPPSYHALVEKIDDLLIPKDTVERQNLSSNLNNLTSLVGTNQTTTLLVAKSRRMLISIARGLENADATPGLRAQVTQQIDKIIGTHPFKVLALIAYINHHLQKLPDLYYSVQTHFTKATVKISHIESALEWIAAAQHSVCDTSSWKNITIDQIQPQTELDSLVHLLVGKSKRITYAQSMNRELPNLYSEVVIHLVRIARDNIIAKGLFKSPDTIKIIGPSAVDNLLVADDLKARIKSKAADYTPTPETKVSWSKTQSYISERIQNAVYRAYAVGTIGWFWWDTSSLQDIEKNKTVAFGDMKAIEKVYDKTMATPFCGLRNAPENDCTAFAWAPSTLVVGYEDGSICEWHVSGDQGSCRPSFQFTSAVSAAAVSGDICAAASKTGEVVVWKSRSEMACVALQPITQCVVALKFSSTKQFLYGSDTEGRLYKWEFRKAELAPDLVVDLKSAKTTVLAVGTSASKNPMYAIGNDSGTLHFWTKGANTKAEIQGEHITSLLFISSTHLVSGSGNGILRLWDVRGGLTEVGLYGLAHTQSIHCLALADAETIMSGSEDCTAVLWKVTADGLEPSETIEHTSPVLQVGFTDNNPTSVTEDKVVHVWNKQGVKVVLLSKFQGHTYAAPPPHPVAIVPTSISEMDYDLLVTSDLLYLYRLRCILSLLTLAAKNALIESLWWSSYLDIGIDTAIISKSFDQADRRKGYDGPDKSRLFLGAVQYHYNTAPPDMRPKIAVLFQIVYRILATEEQLPDRIVYTDKDYKNEIRAHETLVRDYQVYTLPWEANVPQAQTEQLCLQSDIKNPTTTMDKAMQTLRQQFRQSVFLMANVANLVHTFPVMATLTVQQMMLLPEQELVQIYNALAPNLRRSGSDGFGDNTILRLWEKVDLAGRPDAEESLTIARNTWRDWWEPLVAYEAAIGNAKAVWRYMAVMLSYDVSIAASNDKTRLLQDQFRIAIGNYIRHDMKKRNAPYLLGPQHNFVSLIDLLILTIAVLSVPSRNEFVEYYSRKADVDEEEDGEDDADLLKKESKKKDEAEDFMAETDIDLELFDDVVDEAAGVGAKTWTLPKNPDIQDLYMQAYNEIYPDMSRSAIANAKDAAPVFIFKDVAKINYQLRKFLPLNPADLNTKRFWLERDKRENKKRKREDEDIPSANKRQRTAEGGDPQAQKGSDQAGSDTTLDNEDMVDVKDDADDNSLQGDGEEEEGDSDDDREMSGDEYRPHFDDASSSDTSDDDTASMATDDDEIGYKDAKTAFDFTFPIASAFPVYKLVDIRLEKWKSEVVRLLETFGMTKAKDEVEALHTTIKSKFVYQYYASVIKLYEAMKTQNLTASLDLHSLLVPGPYFYTGDLGSKNAQDDKPQRLIEAARILRDVADCVENNSDSYITTREALKQYDMIDVMPEWNEISKYKAGAQKAAEKLEAESKAAVTPYINYEILHANDTGSIYGAGCKKELRIDLAKEAIPAAEACLQVARLMPWLSASTRPGMAYLNNKSFIAPSIRENLNPSHEVDQATIKEIIELLQSEYDTIVWDPQREARVNFWQAIVGVTPPNSQSSLITAAGLYLLATPLQMWTVAHSRRYDRLLEVYHMLRFDEVDKQNNSTFTFVNPYRTRLELPLDTNHICQKFAQAANDLVNGGRVGDPVTFAAVAVEMGGVVSVHGHQLTAELFLRDDWWKVLLLPTKDSTVSAPNTPLAQMTWEQRPAPGADYPPARLNSVLSMLEPAWREILNTLNVNDLKKTEQVGENFLFKLIKTRVVEGNLGGNLE